jgi:hypothetical protein
MKKISFLVLAAILGAATVSAMPAVASTGTGVPYCADGPDQKDFNSNIDHYQNVLRGMGVNALDITLWNGCLRATQVDSSGKTSMVFYDPITLEPLNGGPVG